MEVHVFRVKGVFHFILSSCDLAYSEFHWGTFQNFDLVQARSLLPEVEFDILHFGQVVHAFLYCERCRAK